MQGRKFIWARRLRFEEGEIWWRFRRSRNNRPFCHRSEERGDMGLWEQKDFFQARCQQRAPLWVFQFSGRSRSRFWFPLLGWTHTLSKLVGGTVSTFSFFCGVPLKSCAKILHQKCAFMTSQSVKRDRKAVCFVANESQQQQCRRIKRQANRFRFAG